MVKRTDGAFWMCFKDWVKYVIRFIFKFFFMIYPFSMFSSFDFCLLPTQMCKKKGPNFRSESIVRGEFPVGTPEVTVQMSIAQKTDVYCQILMECCCSIAGTELGFQNGASNLFGNQKSTNLKTLKSEVLI